MHRRSSDRRRWNRQSYNWRLYYLPFYRNNWPPSPPMQEGPLLEYIFSFDFFLIDRMGGSWHGKPAFFCMIVEIQCADRREGGDIIRILHVLRLGTIYQFVIVVDIQESTRRRCKIRINLFP